MLEATIDYKEKYEELYMEHINLRHELDQLKRLVFGSRHERFIPATTQEQLALGLEAGRSSSQTISPAPVQTIEYTRTKKVLTEKVNSGRMKLPDNLPREEVVLEPDEDVSGLTMMGNEITEELERIPGKLFVRQYIRPKYARADGQGVVIADLPARPIDNGILALDCGLRL